MKNLFQSSKSRKQKYQSRIIATEITDWHSTRCTPSHISVPSTESHRGRNSMGKIEYTPRVCPIDAGEHDKANHAWDILKYQLSDGVARQKHLENVRFNLEHRLEVAKSQGNKQLVDILCDEYKQLETSV